MTRVADLYYGEGAWLGVYAVTALLSCSSRVTPTTCRVMWLCAWALSALLLGVRYSADALARLPASAADLRLTLRDLGHRLDAGGGTVALALAAATAGVMLMSTVRTRAWIFAAFILLMAGLVVISRV